jgi:hypothetical protein
MKCHRLRRSELTGRNDRITRGCFSRSPFFVGKVSSKSKGSLFGSPNSLSSLTGMREFDSPTSQSQIKAEAIIPDNQIYHSKEAAISVGNIIHSAEWSE